ncbi:MAG: trypsin-like peptidase domain-containing protein [Candidatus Aureabacteria bacterium]|nr:trypsin-like peptidase domain-containing protein [Candidatus Auribacterota bacterium]
MIKNICGGVLAAILVCSPCVFGQEGAEAVKNNATSLQAAFMEVAKDVGPAVVGVYNIQRARVLGFYHPGGGRYFDMDDFLKLYETPIERRSIGSGVLIDPAGYILTNEHVVGNADAIEIVLADGRKFQGKVLGKDVRSDLAVLKIDATGLPSAKLGDSEGVRTGQWAIAIGNPFGIFEDNPMPTMTVGVISALHRNLGGANVGGRYYGNLIQTDAAINPGNSGGPLLNLKGEVIGINAAIISPSGAYAGIGFAIPINRAKEIIEDLKKGQEIEYGWLGVGVQQISDDLAEQFKLPDKSGALAVTIMQGSPAESAGLRVGDVIRECGGISVHDAGSLSEAIGRIRPGKSVDLKIVRDGQEKIIPVMVGRKGERVM